MRNLERYTNNNLFALWDVLVIAGTVFLSIFYPLNAVFQTTSVLANDTGYWVTTIVFLADIPISYWRAEHHTSDTIIEENYTGRKYLKTWLPIDLVAAIPFGVITMNQFVPLIRLIKLAKVIHFMRLLMLKEISIAYQQTLFHFLFWCFLSAHWLSCGWLSISGINPLLDMQTNYLQALYWVITTLTSVGYGDIVPVTNAQIIYAIAVQIIGFGVLGFLIGNIASYLTRKDPATVEYVQNLDRLKALIQYRHLPKDLQNRIYNYYTYLWKKRLGYDEASFLHGLPTRLKREVSIFLKKEIIDKIYLFRKANQDFVIDVALHLSPEIAIPGECVVEEGEEGDAMYFIVSGELIAYSGDDKILARFKEGDFFGEISLFTKKPRTATVKALTYCDLYKLSRNIFEKLTLKHPEVGEAIKEKALIRAKENREQLGND